MREILRDSRTIWLRTDRPVVPTNTSDWYHMIAVQDALQHGVFALADPNRREFFEIEIDDHWYYIHIPSCIAGVHLIAVRAAAGYTTEVLKKNFNVISLRG